MHSRIYKIELFKTESFEIVLSSIALHLAFRVALSQTFAKRLAHCKMFLYDIFGEVSFILKNYVM